VVEFDYVFLLAIFASIITTLGGFFAMWNIIRTSRRDAKEDTVNIQKDSETRLKDHINSKLEIVDNKIDGLKDDIKKNDTNYERRFGYIHTFFTDWIQRIEDEIDIRRHKETKKPKADGDYSA
jgi:hypothetical protein